ncbi:hypothetical protein BH09GEM1_BH09GEM1_46620 [soil metagenome]
MTEGNVYACSWKRVRGRYGVWLESDPAVMAEDADFDAADELLYERIMEHTGDGENSHAYDPPEPRSTPADSTERGQLWTLGRPVKAYMAHPAEYFEQGLCDNCLMPRGERTNVPMTVTGLKSGGDSARVGLADAGFAGPSLTIVSEAFVSALTDAEQGCFEWRPIQHNLRAGTFFEVVHRVPTISLLSAKGRDTYYGRCKTCKFEWVMPNSGRGKPDKYVSQRDLPKPARPLMAIGPWAMARLAVYPARWKELVGKPGMRGIKGDPVAIIAESAVERRPHFESRARERRKE